MAVKDTNRRITVTLSSEEYWNLETLAAQSGTKSLSKTVRKIIQESTDNKFERDETENELYHLALMFAFVCEWNNDWMAYNTMLRDTQDNPNSEIRSLLIDELSEDDYHTHKRNRESYLEWCESAGRQTYI